MKLKKRYAFSEYVIDPNRFRLRKVLSILALVVMFVRKLRRLSVYDTEHSFDILKSFSCKGCQYIVTTGTIDVIKCEPGKVVCLSDDDIKAALTYFFIKVTQPLQNDKNRQKYFFPDFCLILIFNPRTTFCEIFGVKILGGVL